MSVGQTILVHSTPGTGMRPNPDTPIRRNGVANAVEAVYKLNRDQVAAAKDAAKANGGDEVFYQVGQDTYVATARSMSRGFQSRFDEQPQWNPFDDQVGVMNGKDAPVTGLTKMTAKGYDNEFQSGSEYANSKPMNWGTWLVSLFGKTHRNAWEKLEKPTYDADAFAQFGRKVTSGRAHE